MFLIGALASCSEEKKEEKDININEQEQAIATVDTLTLRKTTFQNQLLCNGKLAAIGKAELQAPKQGDVLLSVLVKNGQHVEKGALLAIADTLTRKADLEKAEQDFERARVELQDKLISLGYDVQSSKVEEWERIVPHDVLHRAELTSGYHTSKYQLATAVKALKDCRLIAPFGGRVANVEGRAHQTCSKFCTLLDDSYFDVDFKILEAELAFVRKGQAVQITPFIYKDMNISGTITEINPTVDDRGLVKVKARMRNTSNELMDGMNVRVIVESEVPNMLVVPKESVVERDGYYVAFMYDTESHRAIWTYIDIQYSNLNQYAITGCERKHTEVKPGDIIITSGNLNLADDTEVRVN